jgi:hypothetical protein
MRLWTVLREFALPHDNGIFIALLAVAAGFLLAQGLHPLDIFWFAAGWAFFLPQEWLTHVYLLHWVCPRNETVYRWMYRLHYGHHDLPNRDDLMYMPLWLTLPMTACNYGFFLLVAPGVHASNALFAGALTGYLVFEWSHLMCHVPLPARGAWARIRERHLAHHFVDERRCHSVSPPAQWIDRLCGHRKAGEGEGGRALHGARSPLCRTIVPQLDPAWTERARRHFARRSSGDLHRSRLWLPERRGTGD